MNQCIEIEDYIRKLESLEWTRDLELFDKLRRIPAFEQQRGVTFKIISVGSKFQLQAAKALANTLHELRDTVGKEFTAKGDETYVLVQNFSSFIVIIETPTSGITFQIEKDESTLIDYMDFTKAKERPKTASDPKKAAQELSDYLNGKSQLKLRLAS